MGKRLNIGLLIDDPDNFFSAQACIGAELGAKALDANLLIFPGHYIGTPDVRNGVREYEYQYNTVFDLVNESNVDVLYVLLGSIGSRADYSVQMKFLDSLPKVPIVTLFTKVEKYQSITFDNTSGFTSMMNHLIYRHNARKIGFVSGPMTNSDAVERLDAFRACMREADIDIFENRIVYGDFTEQSDEFVNQLLDQNDSLDAIVFANDTMVIGGYRALEKRGLKPGKDIIVAGFDDSSFASKMNPPLTTVEASSANLVYRAVLKAEEFLNSGKLSRMKVETFMVQRESCGCDGLNMEDMFERLALTNVMDDAEAVKIAASEYLFGVYNDDPSLDPVKDCIGAFCDGLENGAKTETPNYRWKELEVAFYRLIASDFLNYTSIERLYNILQTFHYAVTQFIVDEKSKTNLAIQFAAFYRKLSYIGSRETQQNLDRFESISQLSNSQINRVYMLNNTVVPYEQLLNGMDTAGFRRAYIYMFQGDFNRTNKDDWKCPNSILLKGIFDENGIRSLSEEQQLLRTELLFNNEFIPTDRRQTQIVTPLFVGEKLYGMLLSEMDCSNLGSITPVNFQLSVALGTLTMIEEQNGIKRSLEISLEQFIQDNKNLTVISKSDELTGLYNRRGFLEHAQKMISSPENDGKCALICYADMDNLKMVNDVYGHDEGDFALREIASILNDAFRHTDVIGRFGGDEFVVFAMVGVDNYEATVKERLELITKRHNASIDKPYPVEMSSGICEFKCGSKVNIYEKLDIADEKLYAEKKAKKAANGSYR